jgi:NAD(P)-dependent dehydrogenase (short-subunit alcohol dehydrogenase family)
MIPSSIQYQSVLNFPCLAPKQKGSNMPTLTQPLTPEARGASVGHERLAGRKILIVGAGQQSYDVENPPIGNGRALSRLLAREGAQVAIADVDRAAVEETARQVNAEGQAAVTIVADAGEPSEIERMVDEAHTGLDGIDGLVVNVGIAGGWGLEHTGAEDWDRVFQVNVRAHYLTCKHTLAVMKDGGAIALTSSIAALMPANEVVAYHSSKAALHGLCIWLAKHAAARGIRVNLVVPGLIDTSLGRLAGKADPSRQERPIPLGRQGTAWEVAHAASFLLSDEASYITGQALLVDGGLQALR